MKLIPSLILAGSIMAAFVQPAFAASHDSFCSNHARPFVHQRGITTNIYTNTDEHPVRVIACVLGEGNLTHREYEYRQRGDKDPIPAFVNNGSCVVMSDVKWFIFTGASHPPDYIDRTFEGAYYIDDPGNGTSDNCE